MKKLFFFCSLYVVLEELLAVTYVHIYVCTFAHRRLFLLLQKQQEHLCLYLVIRMIDCP